MHVYGHVCSDDAACASASHACYVAGPCMLVSVCQVSSHSTVCIYISARKHVLQARECIALIRIHRCQQALCKCKVTAPCKGSCLFCNSLCIHFVRVCLWLLRHCCSFFEVQLKHVTLRITFQVFMQCVHALCTLCIVNCTVTCVGGRELPWREGACVPE